MNVYEKLAKARVMFQANNPKMSGKNTYAGYTYFELSDILPVINKIGAEIGFVCEVSFSGESATLLFRNTEKPDEHIIFTSPMSKASLKGCHEVQNLGAVLTYIKRYLYQNAFEIVESEQLDRQEAKQQVRAEEKKKIDDDEYLKLKIALVEYIEAGFFEYPENVERVIRDKNIVQMKKALETAKEKESENNK